jgi:hypothetical protein
VTHFDGTLSAIGGSAVLRLPAAASQGHLEDAEREETALLFQPVRMHRPGPVEERQAPRASRLPPLTGAG